MSMHDVPPLQPWQRTFYNSFGIIRLHEEIIDFCNYITPTVLESKVRTLVVEKLSAIIKGRWPLASIQVFGSFATGLYLPTSDIDIVVFGEWQQSPLWTVDKLLRDNDIATNIRVIEKATVPIVKFVDKETGIYVDISFNKDNGIKSIPMIHEYMTKYRSLRCLFLVLKQFMLQRDLNEVWTGGIGSYSLMLLCVSFLQQYNKNFTGEMNLGCLLMEFFELYGRCFNFLNTSISVASNGVYKMKYDGKRNGPNRSFISIDDPIEKENDVARSCYGLFNIRSAFCNAYCKLFSKTVPACITANNGDSTLLSMHDSVLATVITVSNDVMEFRRNICTKFGHLVDHDCEKIEIVLPKQTVELNDECSPTKHRAKKKIGFYFLPFLDRANYRVSFFGFRKYARRIQKKRIAKKVLKKMNKANNWSDLADWSHDHVFNSKC